MMAALKASRSTLAAQSRGHRVWTGPGGSVGAVANTKRRHPSPMWGESDASWSWRRRMVLLLLGFLQGPLNLAVRPFLTAMNGLRVEAEEDSDAVARAAGDLCGGYAGLQP